MASRAPSLALGKKEKSTMKFLFGFAFERRWTLRLVLWGTVRHCEALWGSASMFRFCWTFIVHINYNQWEEDIRIQLFKQTGFSCPPFLLKLGNTWTNEHMFFRNQASMNFSWKSSCASLHPYFRCLCTCSRRSLSWTAKMFFVYVLRCMSF